MVVVANPRQFKIPDWFLNRQKDYKDGKFSQVVSNALDMKLRDDLERLKKIRYILLLLSMAEQCFHDFVILTVYMVVLLLSYGCLYTIFTKNCRNHRGLRHYWGLRVRGQHTKTTGRRGKTVGVSKKR